MRTYGTVTLDKKGREWVVEAEPHVLMRLKRVFGKAESRAAKSLTLSATAENCKDLQWFMLQYPMQVSHPDRLASLADEHRERELKFAEALSGRGLADLAPLKRPAREYQKVAAAAWHASRGLLLGDEVGLGKTSSSLCALNDPSMLPALVVTLTHLPKQWQAEINTCTDFTTHILKSTKPYDISKDHGGVFPDVVLTSYSKLDGWHHVLAHGIFKSVVFDEAAELRNDTSKRYAAARYLSENIGTCMSLSATPIYNYGGEIFHVLDATKPGCLGSKAEFLREWCIPVGNGKYKVRNPKALGAYLRDAGLMLRRTREEVGRELPPMSTIPHYIPTDAKALEAFGNDSETHALAELILSENAESFKGQRMQASAEFDMRLRQATGVAKAPAVADFVRMLHEESGSKVVLFAWHHACFDLYREKLKDLNPVFYTGRESPVQKEASKKAFVEGDAKVLVISLRAGAGLDGLQHVSYIGVFGELDWSPGVLHQCAGRINRDGQKYPVLMYYLLSEEGSDPVMADVVGVKRQQLDGINNPHADLIESLQVDPDHVKKLAERYLSQKKGQ